MYNVYFKSDRLHPFPFISKTCGGHLCNINDFGRLFIFDHFGPVAYLQSGLLRYYRALLGHHQIHTRSQFYLRLLAKVNPSIDPGTCRNFPSDGFLLCGKKPNVEGKKSKRVTDLKKTKWSKTCTLCVFWCGFWMFLGVFASVVCLACAIVMLIQP